MNYASVCDGIGAAHVAWQPLGWQCEWTAEIDAFPSAVVEQRWGFPNRGDMTRFKEWDDAPIDLLVGGTPCQSFSVAGLRKGLHDPRGGLMLTFLEIAQRHRPRWVVWENVPGVLSSNGGRDFGSFLGALGELGYGWAYRVLDAQWFGVAQRRRRVFVVGCLGDERRAAQVLFESESVRRDNPPSRAKGEGATYDVAPCIGASGRGFERAGETRGQDPVVAQPYRVANCLTQRMYKGINTTCDEGQTPVLAPQAFYSTESRCDGIPVPDLSPPLKVGSNGGGQPPAVAFTKSKRAQSTTDDESRVPGEVSPTMSCFDQGDTRATTVVAVRTAQTSANGHGVAHDVTHTLDRVQGQAVAFSHSAASNSHGIAYVEEGTPPLRGGGAGNSMPAVAQAMSVRRLTPRECERLQGFPDDYTLVEYRKKPAADGPRYRALGNSMAVPVMRWIGERIKMVDELRSSP